VNRDLFYYLMTPLLLMASLLQSTAATRLQVGGVKPDLVLLLVICGTLLYGSRAGIVWAFIGGLTLDIFSGGPMGGSSLALMVPTYVVGLGQRTLSRFNVLVPLGAAMIGTLLYGITYVIILSWVENAAQFLAFANAGNARYNLAFWPTLQFIILPALFYNTMLMLFVTPLLNRVPERTEAMNI
jgi:rod shape-determining protein MreD